MSREAQRGELTPPKPRSLKMANASAAVPTPCVPTVPASRGRESGAEGRAWGRLGKSSLLPFPFQSSIRASRGTIGGYFLAGRSISWWPVSRPSSRPSPHLPAPTSPTPAWTKATAPKGVPGSGLLLSGPEAPGNLRDLANPQLGPACPGRLLSVGPTPATGPTEPTQSVPVPEKLKAGRGRQTPKQPDGCGAGGQHGARECLGEASSLQTVEVGLGKVFSGK